MHEYRKGILQISTTTLLPLLILYNFDLRCRYSLIATAAVLVSLMIALATTYVDHLPTMAAKLLTPSNPINHEPHPKALPSRSKLGLMSFMPMNFFCLAAVYGGYLTSIRPSIHAGVVVTLLRCVKVSKLALPLYAPWPLVPTPPKGMVGMDPWKKPSLREAPPLRVCFMIC